MEGSHVSPSDPMKRNFSQEAKIRYLDMPNLLFGGKMTRDKEKHRKRQNTVH